MILEMMFYVLCSFNLVLPPCTYDLEMLQVQDSRVQEVGLFHA